MSLSPLTPDSTLDQICAAWLDDFKTQIHEGERKAKTEVNYLYALGHLGDLRQLRLSALTVPVIHAWHRDLKKVHGKGPAFLAYAALRTVISWLRLQGVVQHNVAARIGITHRSRQTLPLQPEQTMALRTALEAVEVRREAYLDRHKIYGLARVVAWSSCRALRLIDMTGRRPSEVCQLRVSNVDLSTGTIVIPDTKTGPSVAMLSTMARALVAQQIAELAGRSDYLFPSPSDFTKPISRHTVGELHHRVCTIAGVRGRQMRSHRNAFIWAALFSGVNIVDAGRAVGHRHVKTTQRYAGGLYVTPGQMQAAEAVEQLREAARRSLQSRQQLTPNGERT